MVCFAEPLEVDDFPLPQKADHIIHIRIVGQTENVVVGEAGFLLRRQILGQICDDVPGDLHSGGRPGIAGGKLRVYAGGVIHKIRVKAGGLDLAVAEVPGELVHQGADHLQMAQLLSTYQGAKR